MNTEHPEPATLTVTEEPTFPRNLFQFRSYDGAKVFVLFLFLLSCYYFLQSFAPDLTWTHWVVSHIPIIGSAVGIASFVWHFFVFTICYCLLWLAFDRRTFGGYAMGLFTIAFGVLYIISPLDFIPDAIPVVGNFDDATIGGASIFLGLRSWLKARDQDKTYKKVISALRKGTRDEALQLLLADKGVKISDASITTTNRS